MPCAGWVGGPGPASASEASNSLSLPLPLEARHMLAGGLAGVVANALLHPLDTIRARLSVQAVRQAGRQAGMRKEEEQEEEGCLKVAACLGGG